MHVFPFPSQPHLFFTYKNVYIYLTIKIKQKIHKEKKVLNVDDT